MKPFGVPETTAKGKAGWCESCTHVLSCTRGDLNLSTFVSTMFGCEFSGKIHCDTEKYDLLQRSLQDLRIRGFEKHIFGGEEKTGILRAACFAIKHRLVPGRFSLPGILSRTHYEGPLCKSFLPLDYPFHRGCRVDDPDSSVAEVLLRTIEFLRGSVGSEKVPFWDLFLPKTNESHPRISFLESTCISTRANKMSKDISRALRTSHPNLTLCEDNLRWAIRSAFFGPLDAFKENGLYACRCKQEEETALDVLFLLFLTCLLVVDAVDADADLVASLGVATHLIPSAVKLVFGDFLLFSDRFAREDYAQNISVVWGWKLSSNENALKVAKIYFPFASTKKTACFLRNAKKLRTKPQTVARERDKEVESRRSFFQTMKFPRYEDDYDRKKNRNDLGAGISSTPTDPLSLFEDLFLECSRSNFAAISSLNVLESPRSEGYAWIWLPRRLERLFTEPKNSSHVDKIINSTRFLVNLYVHSKTPSQIKRRYFDVFHATIAASYARRELVGWNFFHPCIVVDLVQVLCFSALTTSSWEEISWMYSVSHEKEEDYLFETTAWMVKKGLELYAKCNPRKNVEAPEWHLASNGIYYKGGLDWGEGSWNYYDGKNDYKVPDTMSPRIPKKARTILLSSSSFPERSFRRECERNDVSFSSRNVQKISILMGITFSIILPKGSNDRLLRLSKKKVKEIGVSWPDIVKDDLGNDGNFVANVAEEFLNSRLGSTHPCHVRIADTLMRVRERRIGISEENTSLLVFPNVPSNLSNLVARDRFDWIGVIPADTGEECKIFVKTKNPTIESFRGTKAADDAAEKRMGNEFTCSVLSFSSKDGSTPENIGLRFFATEDETCREEEFRLAYSPIERDVAERMISDASLIFLHRN